MADKKLLICTKSGLNPMLWEAVNSRCARFPGAVQGWGRTWKPMDPSVELSPKTPDLPLELAELERALSHLNLVQTGFEGAVLQALEQIGGELLFHMRMDGMADCDWIAAAAVGESSQQTIALIAQPTDDGPLRVEDAATSELPVARIAEGYAEVMRRLDVKEPAEADEGT